jgi:CRP-like cAMP-binding protein
MASVMQTAACNGLHTAHQRYARWLLQTADRLGRDRLEATQETLALLLGVRRATITLIAGDLARAGLIAVQRRTITLLDRAGLEDLTCECYRVVKSQFARVR